MMSNKMVINKLNLIIDECNKNIQPIIKDALKQIEQINVPKEYDKCLRCGKKLKNIESRLRGYGDECYKIIHHPIAQKKCFSSIEKIREVEDGRT